ncbi:PE-PPE domain-containing protein [Mycolicibacterium monacense]|uniref:PE-PPE domain-containing protein n=1 Tax=Mycolicibacterium monacense TaxID=85693 RepID=UPI001F27E090|nr:PE-PPE domain-containing protein [Mycolicibacterium monacense]
MTGATTAIAPSVDLVALITPANSTSQIFAGTTYYGTDYTEVYGDQQVVPFFLGPQGIADAIRAANDDPDGTVVLSSGWGAGQTGTALGMLSEEDRESIELVILDNNTNRAGGGFWTTYSPFAPLLLTSAEPTPSDTGVPVLDVAYEYNINSNAPVDPLNPFALSNSLVAYLYGYGAQQTAEVPNEIIAEAKNPEGPHYHYVLDSEGNYVRDVNGDIVRTPLPGSTTTYVTFESDGLPLVRPLRLLPGGDIVADALEPTLTELVNAGYNDGKGVRGDEAIPLDPTVERLMQPGSSLTAFDGVPESASTGVDADVETTQEDLAEPTKLVTEPVEEVGKLPVLSTLADDDSETLLPNLKRNTTGAASDDDESDAPAKKPGQRFAERINDVVKKVTGGASIGAKTDKPADSADGGEAD